MSTHAACAGFRSALDDAGVGGPIPPALEAHLAGCASCRVELEALRGLSRAIDEELRATLAVEPSPDLLPRVRAATEARRAGGGLFAPRWLGWAGAAFALTAVAFLASRPGEPRQPHDAPRTARALPAPARSPASIAAPPAEPLPAPASPPTRVGDLPVVLVAPDGERALALFVAGLERRRAEPGSLLAGGADVPPLKDLDLGSTSVEPLTITPLGRTE
jgi:hypothetical protein